jgi:hypothetical protein
MAFRAPRAPRTQPDLVRRRLTGDGDGQGRSVDKKQSRAFAEFVSESGDTLLRTATLLTSDPQLAEDLY